VQKSKYAIGITGHRSLPAGSLSALTAELKRFFREKAAEHGASNVTVLSSIAEGTDMLCAKLAYDEGFRLVVPLSLPATEYRKGFTETAASEFDMLLSLADDVFVAPFDEPPPENPSHGFCYRQAGLYVVKHCDVLLTIWDGVEKDTPDGAGTWESVQLARCLGKTFHRIAV